MTRFRLSTASMRTMVSVAAAMTATISGLVWMVLVAQGSPHTLFWTVAAGAVFFAFCSAALLWRYLRDDVILAALPTGLFDARWRREPVAWDAIRELVLRRVENEFELDVYLWRPQAQATNRPDHVIEIAPLEGGVEAIVAAIARHAEIRTEQPDVAWARGRVELAGKERM
jgi:hypothetical protein